MSAMNHAESTPSELPHVHVGETDINTEAILDNVRPTQLVCGAVAGNHAFSKILY